MDFNSYEFTASDPAWSAIASILPSVIDPITLPDILIDQDAIYRACEVFGLPSVLGLEVGLPPSLIGAGASYQVYAQKLDEWDRMVAVKHIRSAVSRGNIEEVPSAWIQQATVLREIYSLCLFNDHPNFVTLLAWGTRGVGADINLFLVTDFAPLGSLDCFLREHGSKLVASQLLKICADIAEGVQAMHSQRMAHGDVKTANVLIFEDPRDKEQYTAKISDLGFSLSLDFDEPDANYRGTDLYNAPEIRGQRSTRLRDLDALACDVYSFGLLVWTVLKLGRFFLGDVPDLTLHGKANVEVRDAVEASQLLEYAMEFAQSGMPQCEAEIVGRLFSGSLQVDPSSRLPMKSLCAIFPPIYRQPHVTKLRAPKDDSEKILARPQFPDVLNVDDQIHSYPQGHKRGIAEKLLRAAENAKNPKGGELAYTASKCYAAGFGVPMDLRSAMHWLDIAAGRSYELARVLTAHEELDWVQVSPESDHSAMEMNIPTARLLEMESSRSRAVFEEIDMNHVESFEVYSNGNLDAIKSNFKESLSRGVRIATIAGYAGCSPQDEAAERGLPLLHWAAGSGRIHLVKAFLEFGADVNATDQFRPWGTPFIYALASGHIDIAEMLLQSGAHVDRSVNDFLFMVPPHRFKRFALLTQQAPRRELPSSTGPHPGPRLGPPGSFRGNETPLSLAAKYNNGPAVKACFGEFGYSWTAEQCYTAYKHAAKNLQATLCHFLLCYAFNTTRTLHSPLTSVFKGSIYDWMLFHGRDQAWLDALESTIAVLVSHGFDVNGYDEDGKTPMCHAVHYHANEPTVASALLAHGASLDQQEGEDGKTVLDYAIAAVRESENVGCVRWLLDHNVPLVVQTWVRFKTTPLHHACYCKAYGAVKALLEHGHVDINFLSDQPSYTALHTACSVNSVPLVQILLQNGADATAANEARITPLEVAVNDLCLEVVDFLLSGDHPLENPHFTPPRSILAYCATKSGSERVKISRLIIKHTLRRSPEHLSAVDVDGESPLAKAAQHENREFMLDLLEAGASIGNPHDAKSAWKYLTSYHGPPYQYYYHTGDTHQMRQYHIVVQALIEDLKKHDQVEARNDDGQTLLCYAAERADVTTVRLLLEAGASPKTATKQGLTPLHVAFMGVMVEGGTVMSWLDQLRSKNNWQGEWAPSASLASLGVVSLLLDAGADLNTSRIDGLTVLHSAILAAWRLDNITGLELLLARGADVNKVVPMTMLGGARPVHFALEAPTIIEAWNICCTPMLDELKKQDGRAVRVTRNIVKTLLACDIDLDVPSDVANTELKPFFQAIRMCDPTSLQVMLQEGVYFKAAITTCSSAAEYAARIIRRRQAEASVDPELVSNLSLSAFVARRAMDEGWQNFEIVADWISGLIESVDIDEVGVTAADAASNRRLCQILRRRDLLSQLMSEDPILPVQPISPSVEITEQQDDQEAGQPQSGETGSTENQNHQRTGQPNRGQGLSILARAAKYGPRSWAQRLSSKEKTQEGSRSQAKWGIRSQHII